MRARRLEVLVAGEWDRDQVAARIEEEYRRVTGSRRGLLVSWWRTWREEGALMVPVYAKSGHELAPLAVAAVVHEVETFTQLKVRLPAALDATLRLRAAAESIPIAEAVRRAIAGYLEEATP